LGIEELPTDMTKIDPSKVYYVVFADDLTFISLDLRALEQVANEFKREADVFDLEVNTAKTKWMVFPPPDPETSGAPASSLELRIAGEEIENVDTFVYLGFELDCMLDDKAHVKRINDRMLKAARATGQVMRDMHCANLISLRRYFITLVASQLYGAIFLDGDTLEWDRAIGVFVRGALSLPQSFPNSICVALLGLCSVGTKVMEERMKFLLRLEARVGSPSFSALLCDRCVLMPLGVGVNARLGRELSKRDILCTLDYREHFSSILQALRADDATERTASLLSADGRAFWTEISENGWLPQNLTQILVKLPFEQVRIFVLFLADSLRWTAFVSYNPCSFCHSEFSSEHFFSCPSAPFLSGREWIILITLCQNEAWQDVVEAFFAVLKRWATETEFLRPMVALNVLEFTPAPNTNPFRLNIF
jgi:hypothetical protein